jgi:predicted amidohydrolase
LAVCVSTSRLAQKRLTHCRGHRSPHSTYRDDRAYAPSVRKGAEIMIRTAGYTAPIRESWRFTNQANAFQNLMVTANVCMCGSDGSFAIRNSSERSRVLLLLSARGARRWLCGPRRASRAAEKGEQ